MARILVADDEPDIRTPLRVILTGDGHQVETAVDGVEAMERYYKRSFDLICVEMDMPGLNGIELTRAIRARLPDAVSYPDGDRQPPASCHPLRTRGRDQ